MMRSILLLPFALLIAVVVVPAVLLRPLVFAAMIRP
jgi:hypothetical protein